MVVEGHVIYGPRPLGQVILKADPRVAARALQRPQQPVIVLLAPNGGEVDELFSAVVRSLHPGQRQVHVVIRSGSVCGHKARAWRDKGVPLNSAHGLLTGPGGLKL